MLSRIATRLGKEVAVRRAALCTCNHHHAVVNKQEVVQRELQYRYLSIVAFALFCDYLLLTLCIPILPALFGKSYSSLDIGLIFAAKPFFQFLANPYMGAQVDQNGPKYPLLFGALVLSLSTFVFGLGLSFKRDLHTAYRIVLWARIAQGIASASIMSAGMTLTALTHHESNRGTAMGIVMMGVALGTLLGPPLGGLFAYFLPLWSPYVLVGALLIGNVAAQWFTLHSHDPSAVEVWGGKQSSLESAKEEVLSVCSLLKLPKIRFVAVVAVLGNSCIGMIEPLVPLYLSQRFGENVLKQGFIFSTATFSYLVFTPIAGMLSDRNPKWRCLTIGLVSLGFGFAFLYSATSIAKLCVSLFFIGGGMSFIDTPSLPLLADIIEVRFVPMQIITHATLTYNASHTHTHTHTNRRRG